MERGSKRIHGLMKALHAPIYAARLRELVRQIIPELKSGDRVLDVGCGGGALGRALLDAPQAPRGVEIRGLERVRRGGEAIPTDDYDGRTIPHTDRSFDVVILADVLHHEAEAGRLIDECARVARRLVIIKDHKREGLLGKARISLIDWAANAPHGVPCLYQYNSAREWTESHRRHGLEVEREVSSLRLYPPGVDFLFGGRLQYLAVLRPIAARGLRVDAPGAAPRPHAPQMSPTSAEPNWTI